MTDLFKNIRQQYQDSFAVHGDSASSVLTPKGRGDIRFSAIEPYVKDPSLSVLDYGCGLGFLLTHLRNNGFQNAYTGVDLVPEFVSACENKHADDGASSFAVIGENQPLQCPYDIVFASGVFNLRSHDDAEASLEYALSRLSSLFEICNKVLICDFMTSHVDFVQEGAQHFDPGDMLTYAIQNLSRRSLIRHDLLPYEFSLIVVKDNEIKRPDSIYASMV